MNLPWDAYIYYLRKLLWVLLTFLVALGSYAGYRAYKLELETDLSALLPPDTPSVRRLNQLQKDLGGSGFYIILLKASQPAEKMLQQTAKAIHEKILEDDYLRSQTRNIIYKTEAANLRKYSLLYMELSDLRKILQRLRNSVMYEIRQKNPYLLEVDDAPPPFYVGDILKKYRAKAGNNPLMDAEKKRYAILIKPSFAPTRTSDVTTYSEKLENLLKDFPLEEGVRWYLTGSYEKEYRQNKILNRDIIGTTGFTILILMVLTIIFFRSVQSVLVIGLPLSFGILFTFFITSIIIGHINIITAFLASILLGLGIDYGVHFLYHYRQIRIRDVGITSALSLTFRELAFPLLAGAISSSAAFIPLAFSDFKPFAEFGIIGFIGILSCILSIFLFLPALIMFLEKKNSGKIHVTRMYTGIFPGYRLWLFAGLLLSFVGLICLQSFPFEYNFSRLNASNKASDIADAELNHVFENPGSPIVYTTTGKKELSRLDELFRSTPRVYAGPVNSILQLEPANRAEKMKVIASMRALLMNAFRLLNPDNEDENRKRNNILRGLSYTDIFDFDLEKVLGKFRNLYVHDEKESRKYFYYVYQNPEQVARAPRGEIDFVRENRAVCGEPGFLWTQCPQPPAYSGASDLLILDDILELVSRDIGKSMLMVLAGLLIVLSIIIRNLKAVLLISLPLFFGILSVLGVYYTLNLFVDSPLLKFNYINIIVFPILLGIGIDDGLHLYRTYRKIGFSRISDVIGSTGNAVFTSNLTTFVGFISLTLSSHVGLASLGLLGGIGIGGIYMAYMIIFPLLGRKLYEKPL